MKEIKIYALSDPNINQFLIRYVGKTKFLLKERLQKHIKIAKWKISFPIHQWLQKINFKAQIKLIEIVPSGKSWKKAEKKWIKYYRDHGYPLLNCTNGGDGFTGRKHSKESIRKMSLSHMGKKTNLGRKFSKEWRQKLSLAKIGNKNGLGYKHTKEEKRKMSEFWKKRRKIYANN